MFEDIYTNWVLIPKLLGEIDEDESLQRMYPL